MKNIDWKDVLERSAKTFVQAAVTCLLMQMQGVDLDSLRELQGSG